MFAPAAPIYETSMNFLWPTTILYGVHDYDRCRGPQILFPITRVIIILTLRTLLWVRLMRTYIVTTNNSPLSYFTTRHKYNICFLASLKCFLIYYLHVVYFYSHYNSYRKYVLICTTSLCLRSDGPKRNK